MRSHCLSSVWISAAVSLTGVGVCLFGGSAALGQEAECGTMESDPETWPDPSQFPPLPAECFGPGGPGPNVCTDDGCIFDVLVVYTPAARDGALALGTTINAVIDQAVLRMNEAFVKSEIQSFIRLVGTLEVPYDESLDDDGLDALGCLGSSSCMPQVHVLRNELKADVVSLFVTVIPGPTAGITTIGGSFNVVQWALAGGQSNWIFAHEMGHDLGARHQISLCTPATSYCHAYVRTTPPAIRTIVSNGGYRIQHYSNPDVSFSGVPTGTATCANNARCIREKLPALAFNNRVSDCNLNEICDAQDIAVGTSQDCEHNGIPDECEDKLACCLEGVCTYRTELCCLYQGGTFQGVYCDEDCNANGVPDACESPGACCRGTDCFVFPQDCCIASGGTYRGAGTRCFGDDNQNGTPDGCESEPLGACCVGGMKCAVFVESYCTSVGGTFGGAGTYCEDCNGNGWPAPCESPATREYGACCDFEGGCTIATECSCQSQFLGAGTTCGAAAGACCTGATCTVVAQGCCSSQGGAFKGANTDCQDCTFNGVADACEAPVRACCLSEDGPCELRTQLCCILDEGFWFGSQSQCHPWTCGTINGPSP